MEVKIGNFAAVTYADQRSIDTKYSIEVGAYIHNLGEHRTESDLKSIRL